MDRINKPGTGEIQAQDGNPPFDFGCIPQQGEVADLAPQQDFRGSQDALLRAFGQNDMSRFGLGALDQLVLKHDRRHLFGFDLNNQLLKGLHVDVGFEKP